MEALNLCIGHPTGIQRQYMLPATMQYHRHEQRINIRKRLPDNLEGVQTVEKQTILVGGVYHRRYKPPLDTTTTNFLLKGFAIDF
jgi:hypothetical protein